MNIYEIESFPIEQRAVQRGKDRGAEVTAAIEARHLDLARCVRADHVVDCASGQFARFNDYFAELYKPVRLKCCKVSYYRDIGVRGPT